MRGTWERLSILLLAFQQDLASALQLRSQESVKIDSSCDTAQGQVIRLAINNARAMASNIDIADLAEDPTGYQFFGSYSISKYGGSTILSLLRKIQALEITAHCSLEEDSKCSSDPLNYGGIFNEGTDAIDGNPTATNSTTLNVSNIALYFCPEFFRQRPLLEQVTDATVYWDNRFNIQKYYPNQATTILRKLMLHVPVPLTFPGPITEKWVTMRVLFDGDSTLHNSSVGCYGVICPKILALLWHGKGISALNAENYAAFALANYIRPNISGKYPWLPDWSSWVSHSPTNPVDYHLHIGNELILDERHFGTHVFELGSPHLVALDPQRNESIIGVVLKEDPSPTLKNLSGAFHQLQESHNIDAPGLIHWGMQREIRCFSDADNLKPLPFSDGDFFMGGLCIPAQAQLPWNNTLIVPPISIGNGTSISGQRKMHSFEIVGDTNTSIKLDKLEYYVGLTHDVWVQSTLLSDFFEGINETEKSANCIATYEDLRDSCKTEDGLSYGGILSLNSQRYGLFARLNNSQSPFDEPDYTLQCAESSAIDAWLVNDIEMAYRVSLNQTCSCWYEELSAVRNLYCPPSGGQCADLEQNMPVYNVTEMIELGTGCS